MKKLLLLFISLSFTLLCSSCVKINVSIERDSKPTPTPTIVEQTPEPMDSFDRIYNFIMMNGSFRDDRWVYNRTLTDLDDATGSISLIALDDGRISLSRVEYRGSSEIIVVVTIDKNKDSVFSTYTSLTKNEMMIDQSCHFDKKALAGGEIEIYDIILNASTLDEDTMETIHSVMARATIKDAEDVLENEDFSIADLAD